MKMPKILKRLLPGCPAEQILEQNAELSRQISAGLAETVQDVTTIFDRRAQPAPAPVVFVERRRAQR